MFETVCHYSIVCRKRFLWQSGERMSLFCKVAWVRLSLNANLEWRNCTPLHGRLSFLGEPEMWPFASPYLIQQILKKCVNLMHWLWQQDFVIFFDSNKKTLAKECKVVDLKMGKQDRVQKSVGARDDSLLLHVLTTFSLFNCVWFMALVMSVAPLGCGPLLL